MLYKRSDELMFPGPFGTSIVGGIVLSGPLIFSIILSMGIENGTFLGTENGTLPRVIETSRRRLGSRGGNGAIRAGALPDLDSQSVRVGFGQWLGQRHCQLAVSQGGLERPVLPYHRHSCLAAIGS